LIRIDFTRQAQGTKNFALYLLILTFPAGHFTKCPGFCPQEGQNPQTSSILFIPNEQLSRQGKSFELFIFFSTPSNKI